MELITTNPSTTMSSREIAELTEKRHDNVTQLIRRLIADQILTPEIQELDYEHRGNTYKQFQLNKRDSLVVVARLSPEFTAAVVDRWQELESQQAPKIPQTMSEALQLAADQARQLEEQAPKVAFVENLVERDTLMTATQVGQKHKISAVKLNKFLDELGGVYNKSVKRGRAFTQSFIDKGYGELKQTEQGYSQALFTPSGEVWINEKLISEGLV